MNIISKRFFLILCGFLFLGFFAEHILFAFFLPEEVPFRYLLTGTFADLFIPCIFLAAGLFLGSGWLIAIFAVLFAFVVFVKTANLCLCHNMLEVFTYANFQVVLEHTEWDTARTKFGPFFWLKGLGVIAGFLGGTTLLIWSGIRFIRGEENRKLLDACRFAVLLILLAGCWANCYYLHYSEEIGKHYFTREFPARPAAVFIQDFLKDRSKNLEEEKILAAMYGYDPAQLSPESEKLLREWGLLPFRNQTPSPALVPGFNKIIVIAVESLQTDYINMKENMTPCLDSLARDYVSFTNYFTGSQPTAWGLDSIFLSRMDYLKDVRMKKNTSICDIFREHGWETWYFSPAVGICFNNASEFKQTFRPDHNLFLEDLFLLYGVKGEHYWGLGDDQLLNCAANSLENTAAEKFFAVISTIDLHDPYVTTGPAAKMKSTGNKFLDSLRSTDANLKVFLDRIMSGPLFDEQTLIVVTADHSATFGVNYTGRKDFFPDRIPLILITKNNRLKDVFDTSKYGSQLDLPATLLGLLGLPVPETFMGKDLRTKKGYALSKSPDFVHLRLPDGTDIRLLTQQDVARTEEERALMEYYRVFYPAISMKCTSGDSWRSLFSLTD